MLRLCGPLLSATGVLHLLFGLIDKARPLSEIARDGFFDAVQNTATGASSDRDAAVWFMLFGALAVIMGGLVWWAQSRTGTLPAFLGWSLLLVSATGVVLMPTSGFWIVLPQAVMMILVSRREPTMTAASRPDISGSGTSRVTRTERG